MSSSSPPAATSPPPAEEGGGSSSGGGLDEESDAARKARNQKDFLSNPGGKALSEMSFEERLAYAEGYKRGGNAFFGEGNYGWALENYADCVLFVERCLYLDEGGRPASHNALDPPAKQLLITAHANSAACHLKLASLPPTAGAGATGSTGWREHLGSAALACDKGLGLASAGVYRKDRLKMLYRRGQARAGMQDWDGALVDLQEAARLDPLDAAVAREVSRVRAARARGEREAAAALKTNLKGFLGKKGGLGFEHPEPPPPGVDEMETKPMSIEEIMAKIQKKKEETPYMVRFFVWFLEKMDWLGAKVGFDEAVVRTVNYWGGVYSAMGQRWVAIIRYLFPSIYEEAYRQAEQEEAAKPKEGKALEEEWAQQMEARATQHKERNEAEAAAEEEYLRKYEEEDSARKKDK